MGRRATALETVRGLRRAVALGGMLLSTLLAGCHPPESARAEPVTPRLANRAGEGMLARHDMQLDLDDWLATLLAVHPEPFAHVDRARFMSEFRAAREALPERADPLQFYATVQRLAAQLKDSHTLVAYPRTSPSYRDSWWPLELMERHGRLLVERTERGLVRGTEVTQISGFSTSRLLRAGAALTSAETEEGARHDAPWAFSVVLWEAGARGPFEVKGKSPSGEDVNVLIGGVVPLERETSSTEVEAEEFSLRWLEGDVAVLELRAMSDVEGFATFVESATGQLVERRAQGLIVDLRENSGGSTEVGELLLERITRKPFTMVAEKHWRVSDQYRALEPESQEYLAAKAGTTLHFRWRPQAPREVSPRYEGKVAVLIGPNTASAAMMLANAVEDFDLAELIGQPTSSPPNYFGEAYRFDLPRTGLPAQSSVARFVRASGDATEPRPVEPDIRLEPTVEQWVRGEDPVLARALQWVKLQR